MVKSLVELSRFSAIVAISPACLLSFLTGKPDTTIYASPIVSTYCFTTKICFTPHKETEGKVGTFLPNMLSNSRGLIAEGVTCTLGDLLNRLICQGAGLKQLHVLPVASQI